MAIAQILDDREPAVVYSPGWLQAGSRNEFNATTTYANNPGLTATLVFQGSQVSVVGTIGPRNAQLLSPQSSYFVDDSAPVTYQALQTSSVQYSTRFYVSPLLPYGQHTLVVTNVLGSDSFFLDYFLVTIPNASDAPTSIVASGKYPSQTSGATTEEKPSSRSDTGTIVGSALGAAALIIVAVAVMFWLRSRHRRARGDPAVNIRGDQSIDTNRSMGQTSYTPVARSGSPFAPTSLPSRATSPQHQGLYQPQNPQVLYDPYDSSAPPPGYAQVSQPSNVRGRPGEYLPSKFTQGHRPATSTGT